MAIHVFSASSLDMSIFTVCKTDSSQWWLALSVEINLAKLSKFTIDKKEMGNFNPYTKLYGNVTFPLAWKENSQLNQQGKLLLFRLNIKIRSLINPSTSTISSI